MNTLKAYPPKPLQILSFCILKTVLTHKLRRRHVQQYLLHDNERFVSTHRPLCFGQSCNVIRVFYFHDHYCYFFCITKTAVVNFEMCVFMASIELETLWAHYCFFSSFKTAVPSSRDAKRVGIPISLLLFGLKEMPKSDKKTIFSGKVEYSFFTF